MFATTPPTSAPVVWQGRTQDGHTVRLTRSGLTKILSNLNRTGLRRLIRGNLNRNREAAVVRAIAQVVSRATRSRSGQNTQVFTAIGKTRTYEIVTQPIGHQQSVIVLVRSLPLQEFEYEGEFESENEISNRPTRPLRRRNSLPTNLNRPTQRPFQLRRPASTGSNPRLPRHYRQSTEKFSEKNMCAFFCVTPFLLWLFDAESF
jgi:hypothetical protein